MGWGLEPILASSAKLGWDISMFFLFFFIIYDRKWRDETNDGSFAVICCSFTKGKLLYWASSKSTWGCTNVSISVVCQFLPMTSGLSYELLAAVSSQQSLPLCGPVAASFVLSNYALFKKKIGLHRLMLKTFNLSFCNKLWTERARWPNGYLWTITGFSWQRN